MTMKNSHHFKFRCRYLGLLITIETMFRVTIWVKILVKNLWISEYHCLIFVLIAAPLKLQTPQVYVKPDDHRVSQEARIYDFLYRESQDQYCKCTYLISDLEIVLNQCYVIAFLFFSFLFLSQISMWSQPVYIDLLYIYILIMTSYLDNRFCSFYQMILSFIKYWLWEDLRTLCSRYDETSFDTHSLSPSFSLSLDRISSSPSSVPLTCSLCFFVFLLCLLHNPNTFQVKRLFSLALVTTKKMRYWDLLGWPICLSPFFFLRYH